MNAISNQDPGPPSAVHATVPSEADEVVRRALERDKDQRYQSAEEFLTTARRCYADLTLPIPVASSSGRSLGGLVPTLAFGAVLVAIAAGIGTMWSWSSGTDARSAREETIPEIMRLIESDDYLSGVKPILS